jgi:hypothetical protein
MFLDEVYGASLLELLEQLLPFVLYGSFVVRWLPASRVAAALVLLAMLSSFFVQGSLFPRVISLPCICLYILTCWF